MSTGSGLSVAFMEQAAADVVDEFIDNRLNRGETKGVQLSRFPGHVAWAHQYNVRDYIGRNLTDAESFISNRSHLWCVSAGGYVQKQPDDVRQKLRKAVAIADRNRQSNESAEVTLEQFAIGLSAGDLNETRQLLETQPNLFVMLNRKSIGGNPVYRCNGQMIDGTLVLQKLIEGKPATVQKPPQYQASKIALEQKDSQSLEGVGRVARVTPAFGFLATCDGSIQDIYFSCAALGRKTADLQSLLKVGDRLQFRAKINPDYLAGTVTNKWRAVNVKPVGLPTTKPTPTPTPELSTISSGRTSNSESIKSVSTNSTTGKADIVDEDACAKQNNWKSSAGIDPSSENGHATGNSKSQIDTLEWSEIERWLEDIEATDDRDRSHNANMNSQDANGILENLSELIENCTLKNERLTTPVATNVQQMSAEQCSAVADLIEATFKKTDTLSKTVKDRPALVDASCQTEVTDEELLLRMLRSAPHLLERVEIVPI